MTLAYMGNPFAILPLLYGIGFVVLLSLLVAAVVLTRRLTAASRARREAEVWSEWRTWRGEREEA